MSSRSLPPSRLRAIPLSVAMAIGGGFMLSSVVYADNRLPQIHVVGTEEADIARQPGAVSMVSREDMDKAQPRSTEDALSRVPGVYIKREEESAVVANIGIRGLSSADYKTLILEDGVPVAPGLFVGNGRYYNPRIQRIDNIEVLKGASSLRYGPSTIGGVINYRTKQPQDGAAVELSGGSFGTLNSVLELGGSAPSGDGVFGAVISRSESDGFMDKGYEASDVMVKAGTAIGDDQWLAVKFTDYDNKANISYRGLFLDDYNAGATYNPAPDDYFLTGRTSFDINHAWDINASMTLNTVFYWSEMYRDYWRYGVDPTETVTEGRWVFTDNLNGNNRAFERTGVESRLKVSHDAFGLPGEAEIGLRYMTEKMNDQTIAAVRETPRTGTISRDRVDTADSVALFVQNRFAVTDRLAVTPGVRVERYEQKRKDLMIPAANGSRAETSNTEVLPGIGATFQVSPLAQVFGSVYRAFSPALNGDALDGLQDQELDAERSTNIELGVRGKGERFGYEATVFRMDFNNQIIPANSNTNFQRTNGGKTFHQGIEAGVDYIVGGGFSVFANATYIPDAEFVGDRLDADGVTVTTPDGNRVTYTPEWIGNAGISYDVGSLQTLLSANYTGAQFTDVLNTRDIQESTSGFFTGRVDSYTTVDLSARYAVNGQLDVFGSVKNLADERYIASLREGIYVGTERSVELGLRYQF